jgi:hypothetical protein
MPCAGRVICSGQWRGTKALRDFAAISVFGAVIARMRALPSSASNTLVVSIAVPL